MECKRCAMTLSKADARLRQGLKRIAGHMGRSIADGHESYHLVMSLRLANNWADVVLQRLGDPEGPTTKRLELTKQEREW